MTLSIFLKIIESSLVFIIKNILYCVRDLKKCQTPILHDFELKFEDNGQFLIYGHLMDPIEYKTHVLGFMLEFMI